MRGGLLLVSLLAALGPSAQLTVRPPISKGQTCGDSPGGVAVQGDRSNSIAFDFVNAVSGSFLLSCSGCALSGPVTTPGTRLSCAQCDKPDGTRSASSVLVSTCETKVFSNTAGQLACERGLPEGAYQESCRDCEVRGTLLECLCDGYPTGIRSSIVMGSCSRFSNEDGRLKCTPGFEDSE